MRNLSRRRLTTFANIGEHRLVVDKKGQEKQTNKMGYETKSNNHVPSGTIAVSLSGTVHGLHCFILAEQFMFWNWQKVEWIIMCRSMWIGRAEKKNSIQSLNTFVQRGSWEKVQLCLRVFRKFYGPPSNRTRENLGHGIEMGTKWDQL